MWENIYSTFVKKVQIFFHESIVHLLVSKNHIFFRTSSSNFEDYLYLFIFNFFNLFSGIGGIFVNLMNGNTYKMKTTSITKQKNSAIYQGDFLNNFAKSSA